MQKFSRGRSVPRHRAIRALALTLAAVVASTAAIAGLGAAPASAAVKNEPYTVLHPQSFYVYLEAGEDFDYAITGGSLVAASKSDALEVAIDGPGGLRTSTVTDLSPTRPHAARTLSAPSAGVYRVSLNSADDSTQTSNADGTGADPSRAYFHRQLTVSLAVTNGGVDRAGRIWSEDLAIYNPSVIQQDLSLWYLSSTGYIYRSDQHGFGGVEADFAADAFGVVANDTCTSAYRSISAYSTEYELADPSQCLGRYRVFLDGAPAADLPTTASWFDDRTSQNWVLPTITQPTVSISKVAFEPGKGSAATISTTISDYIGQVAVTVSNAQGKVLRSYSTGLVGAGPDYTIPFDGLDDSGKEIAASEPLTFSVAVSRTGEIHFVSFDVETRTGITVTALNGPRAGTSALNWNDSELASVTRGGVDAATPQIIGDDVDSSASDEVHGWACLDSNGVATASLSRCNADQGPQPASVRFSWGDRSYVEEWVVDSNGAETKASVSAAPHADDGSKLQAGDSTANACYSGQDVTFDVVDLDAHGNPVGGSLVTSPSDPAPSLGLVGAEGKTADTLTVAGQGTWKADSAKGTVTFVPAAGVLAVPTPQKYIVWDQNGRSDSGLLTIAASTACGSGSGSTGTGNSGSTGAGGTVIIDPPAASNSDDQADTSASSTTATKGGDSTQSVAVDAPQAADELAYTGQDFPVIWIIVMAVLVLVGSGLLLGAKRVRGRARHR